MDEMTRDQLEAKANELNVEFTADTSDDDLRTAIKSAEEAAVDGGAEGSTDNENKNEGGDKPAE